MNIVTFLHFRGDLWKRSSILMLAVSSLDLAKYWSILARSSMSILTVEIQFGNLFTYKTSYNKYKHKDSLKSLIWETFTLSSCADTILLLFLFFGILFLGDHVIFFYLTNIYTDITDTPKNTHVKL